MKRQHPELNQIYVGDDFRVVARSLMQDVWYVFSAHGPMSEHRGAEFSCHLYDSPALDHAAYVEVQTLGSDHHDAVRCCGSAPTLDELAHNMDWAHRPSELAQLRQMLAGRRRANDGQLIGGLAALRITQERQEQLSERNAGRMAEALTSEIAERLAKATRALDAAREEVMQAACFGLKKPLQPVSTD